MQCPETPAREESIPILESDGQHGIHQNVLENGTIISAFHYSCQRNGQLEILQVLDAHAHCIF